MELIKDIKRGKSGPTRCRDAYEIAGELAASPISADACTELSVLPVPDVGKVPIIDSLDVLTQEIVHFGTMGDRRAP